MATAKKFNPNEYLTKLKGKDYLEVKYRLVWFREDHPDGSIETDIIELTDARCVMRARVQLPGGGITTGYGSEEPKDFKDYIEKAETKAIGRALAALGYGTQFAPELDEGDRIVDSPVQPKQTPQRGNQEPARAPVTEAAMKRIHALLEENGLNHQHLHAYAVANDFGSVKNMAMDDIAKVAEGLKTKTDASVKYLTKLLNDFELAEENAKLNAKIDAQKAGK